MKKLLFSVLAITALSFSAEAQQDEFPIVGIKAGVNLSNYGADADTDGKTGFYAGVSLDIPCIGMFHFQPEILYSKEGADNDQGIDYLRIPAMAKFYFTEGLNLQVGPVLGAKIGTENKYVNKATKALDYGVAGGLSYEFTPGFLVEGRYYLGLEDINKSETTDKITNTTIQIGIGYRF